MAADNPQKQNESRTISPNSLANLRPNANPGGRPKIPDEVKEMLKANTLPAVNTLIEVMNDKKAKHADRIRCAETVLDRVYGKAAQPIVGNDEFDPLRVNLLDAEQRRALIREFISSGQSPVD